MVTGIPSAAITPKTDERTWLDLPTLAMSVMMAWPLVSSTLATSDSSSTTASSTVEPLGSRACFAGSCTRPPASLSFRLTSSRLFSVRETETSEEAITSMDSLFLSKQLKTRARKPYAPSIRVLVMSTSTTPAFDVIADTSGASGRCVAEISVPGAFRLYEFLTRTLVPVFIAGCIATGCSTCAPKYASSAASSNDTSGTGFASGHTRGSAVRMPSTSFHT